MPIASALPQPWFTAPRVRPLTTRDFADFCAHEHIKITCEIHLGESYHALRAAHWGKNLRAAVAIFELG